MADAIFHSSGQFELSNASWENKLVKELKHPLVFALTIARGLAALKLERLEVSSGIRSIELKATNVAEPLSLDWIQDPWKSALAAAGVREGLHLLPGS